MQSSLPAVMGVFETATCAPHGGVAFEAAAKAQLPNAVTTPHAGEVLVFDRMYLFKFLIGYPGLLAHQSSSGILSMQCTYEQAMNECAVHQHFLGACKPVNMFL